MDLEALAKLLWERLRPSTWPFSLEDLPIGCALVGGSVRDGLLDCLKSSPDLDLIVPSNAISLATKLSNRLGGTCVVLDKERDIARLVFKEWTVDFAKQIGETINDDLSRRDYTINSIALTLETKPKILDPFGGIKDLGNKTLVAVNENNLVDDPLRLIRALRLMSELNLSLQEETKELLKIHSKLLNKVPPERIKNEVQMLIKGTWAQNAINVLEETRLLKPWSNKSKVFISKLNSLQDAKNFKLNELAIALPLSRLVHLFSDSGLISLRFSRQEIQICKILRKWKSRNDGMAYKTLKEFDLFQLHIELEKHLPALILDLPDADQKIWLSRWRNKKDSLFHPASPLNGSSIKKILGVSQGPIIGEIIQHLAREKAFNRLHNRYEAVQLARNLWKQKQPLL